MSFTSESNNRSSINILNWKKLSVLISFFIWLFGVRILSNFTYTAVLWRRSSHFRVSNFNARKSLYAWGCFDWQNKNIMWERITWVKMFHVKQSVKKRKQINHWKMKGFRDWIILDYRSSINNQSWKSIGFWFVFL